MVIVYELKIRKRKHFFNQVSQFLLNWFSPFSYKHNKSVYVPSHPTSWHKSIIAGKFCFYVFSLCAEIFFRPYLPM